MTDKLALTPKKTIEAIAEDIGKEVAHHIEIMYPEAAKAGGANFLLSVRNKTYNEIMSVLTSENDVAASLATREAHRRYIRAFCKKVRKSESR